MNKKGIDHLIKCALSWIENQKKTKERVEDIKKGCPAEEALSEYIENHLNANEKEKVEKHLALCSDCRAVVENIVKLRDEEPIRSESLIKAKIGEVSESLKISLNWIQGHLGLKDTNAQSLPFWSALNPVLVRGENQSGTLGLPPFSKVFKEFKIFVRIKEEEEGKCEIKCQISSLSKQAISPRIRADLVQAERTLSSYPLQDDSFLFQGIEPGKYEIKIREDERQLAHLSIDVSREDLQ